MYEFSIQVLDLVSGGRQKKIKHQIKILDVFVWMQGNRKVSINKYSHVTIATWSRALFCTALWYANLQDMASFKDLFYNSQEVQ